MSRTFCSWGHPLAPTCSVHEREGCVELPTHDMIVMVNMQPNLSRSLHGSLLLVLHRAEGLETVAGTTSWKPCVLLLLEPREKACPASRETPSCWTWYCFGRTIWVLNESFDLFVPLRGSEPQCFWRALGPQEDEDPEFLELQALVALCIIKGRRVQVPTITSKTSVGLSHTNRRQGNQLFNRLCQLCRSHLNCTN